VEEKGYLPSPAGGRGAGAARDLADDVGQPSRLAGSPIREGEKCIVAVDPRYFRPTEVETLLGDPAKAKAKLGWTPKITFDELVAEMVREDLKSAERDELVKKHGYKAMDYHEHCRRLLLTDLRPAWVALHGIDRPGAQCWSLRLPVVQLATGKNLHG
jgi:hypothetical protein